MGRRGTYEIVIGANGEPLRRELKKSEADLKSWNASVERMITRIEAGEKKAARSYAVIAAAMKKLGAEAPLTERQLAKVRGEIERLERAGHPVPETLRKLFPPPDAAAQWRKEVDGVRGSLQQITADEAAAARALQQLSQAVRELGGVEQLTARQLAHVREEVERLQRAGAKVVPLRLQPAIQAPAPVSRSVTDSTRWQSDLARLRSELTHLGRDETRALAALGKVVDEMGGLGAQSRLSAEQIAHVRHEVERLTAAGGRAPKSLAALSPSSTAGLGSELKAGLAGELENAAQGYAGNLGGVGAAIARVHPLALGLTAAVGGVVAVLGTGVSVLRQWSGELLEAAGHIQDVATQTGQSTTTLQEWQAAGRLSGVSLDSIAEASVKLSRSLEEGGAGVTGALTELGLSLDELRGLDPAQQFAAVADAIARVPESGKQAALTMQLFKDKSGGLLKLLRDDFRGASDDARRFGLVLSEDTIRKADALGDALTTLTGAWAGLKAEIAATIVTSPTAKDSIRELTELVARYALQVREAKQADLGALGHIAETPLLGSIAGLWRTATAYADAALPELGPLTPQRGRGGGMATATADQFFASGTATATGRAAAFDAMARYGVDNEEQLTREQDALFALQDEVTSLGAQHRSTYAGMVTDIERTIAARRREALMAGNGGAQIAQLDRIRGLQIAEARRSFVRGVLGEDASDAAKSMRDLQTAVELARQGGALTTAQFQALGAALDAAARKGEQIPGSLAGDLQSWRATSGPWGETEAAAPQIQAQYDALKGTLDARLAAGTMTPTAWQAAAKDFDALAERARAARVEVQGLRQDALGAGREALQQTLQDDLGQATQRLLTDVAQDPGNIDVQAAAWERYAQAVEHADQQARAAGLSIPGLDRGFISGVDRERQRAQLTQEFRDLDTQLAELQERGAEPATFSALLQQFDQLADTARLAGIYVGGLQGDIDRLRLREDATALSKLRAEPLEAEQQAYDKYLQLDAAFNPASPGGRAPTDRTEWTYYAHALQQARDALREMGADLPAGLESQLNEALRHARIATVDWQQSLVGVVNTFDALGIRADSTLGRIGAFIPAAGAGIDGLVRALHADGGFAGWGKTATSNRLALGAAAAQVGVTASSLFGGQSTTAGRFFGGGALGAQVGSIAGPLGTALGGVFGGVVNAIFGAPWKGASRAAARFFGHAVSEELAKAIDATAKRLNTDAHTASMLHISDFIQESGADPRSFAGQTVDLANAIKLGVLPAREGLTELGKTFALVAAEAERSGTAGDRALRTIIGRARELKLDVPEIRDYLSGQTDALIGSVGFIATSSTRQRELFDRQGNPLYRHDRAGNQLAVLDEDGNPVTDKHGNVVYQRATETIVEQTGGIQIATEEDARAQGTIFGVAWATAVRQRGFVGAADALRDSFSNLTTTAGELGFDISSVLGDIPALMDLTAESNPFRGAATGAQQLSEALKAVANEDIPLTGAQFAAFEEQARRAFDQAKAAAIDKGYDSQAADALALEAAAPLLQRLVDVSRNYNIELGEGTQNLLDMAQASDVAFRTDSTDRLIDAINALTQALGGVPAAAERAGGALGRLGERDYGGGYKDYFPRGDFGAPGLGAGAGVPAGASASASAGPKPGLFNPDAYTAAAGFGPRRLERDTIIHAHRGELAMVVPASAGPLGFMSASSGFYSALSGGSSTAPALDAGAVPFVGQLYGSVPELDLRAFNLDRSFGPTPGGGVAELVAAAAGEPVAQAFAPGSGGDVSVGGPVLNATFNHGFVTVQQQREYMRQFERDLARSLGRGLGPLYQAMVDGLRRQGVRIGAQR